MFNILPNETVVTKMPAIVRSAKNPPKPLTKIPSYEDLPVPNSVVKSQNENPRPIARKFSASIERKEGTDSSRVTRAVSRKNSNTPERAKSPVRNSETVKSDQDSRSPHLRGRNSDSERAKSPSRSEASPLKEASRNVICKTAPKEFDRKAEKKRKKLAQKEKKKHGWEKVLNVIKSARKDRTMTATEMVFNFAIWFEAIEKCKAKSLEKELSKHNLFVNFTSDTFITLIDDVAKAIEDRVFHKVLFSEPISYLNQLLQTYDSEAIPEGLEKLCRSTTVEELLELLSKVPPSEDKEMMLWCIGGEKTVEVLQDWLKKETKDATKLQVFYRLQRMEFTREEQPSIIQLRKRSAASLPVGAIRPKELVPSQAIPEDEENEIEEEVLSRRREEELELKKHKTRRELLKDLKNLLCNAAKVGNPKRETIEGLQNTQPSCWTHGLERRATKTIVKQIFSVNKKNLQESKGAKFFVDWVDTIAKEVVNKVIKKNTLLESPLYFLGNFLQAHKDHGNTPPVGLEELCATTNLSDFMKKLQNLPENNETEKLDKEMIRWAIGGDPVISIMDKWLREEHMDGIRLQVLNYLSDIAAIRKSFTGNTFLFPETLKVPQLTNERVVRNWFPSGLCILDKLFFNSREILFVKPPVYKEGDDISLDNQLNNKIQKQNLNKLLQNLLQEPERDFSIKVEEILSKEHAEKPCEFPELLLHGIELSQPIVDVLYKFFKGLHSGFGFKIGPGLFIARFSKFKGQKVAFEKPYIIVNNGFTIGSFKLSWTCSLKDPFHVTLDECKVTALRLGLCN